MTALNPSSATIETYPVSYPADKRIAIARDPTLLSPTASRKSCVMLHAAPASGAAETVVMLHDFCRRASTTRKDSLIGQVP